MKKFYFFCFLGGMTLASCSESDSPQPASINLNGTWEGILEVNPITGGKCEMDAPSVPFRVISKVNKVKADTTKGAAAKGDTIRITFTEQTYSKFARQWQSRSVLWRGFVKNEVELSMYRQYNSGCTQERADAQGTPESIDSAAFISTVRVENGYYLLDLEGTETKCSSAPADKCVIQRRYTLRKKL